MFNRPSIQSLLINEYFSKLQDNKILLFFGLITKINTQIDTMIKKQENKTQHKMNQFHKSLNKNEKTCLSLIEPQNKQLKQIHQCKKYYVKLHQIVLKYFRKKQKIRNDQAIMNDKKKKITVKFSKPIQQFKIKENNYKSSQKSIIKIHKQFSQKSLSTKTIQIHIPSQPQIIQLTPKNSVKNNRTKRQYLKGGNRYIARKKQQVFHFRRLNKVLENFSQRNQITAGMHTLSMFIKSLSQGKKCLSSSVNQILNQKQQFQVRIESYIDNLTEIIKEIILNTSKIIPNGQGFMDSIKYKMETITKQSNRVYTRSRKYIDLAINYEFQAKIKGFMKICSFSNQILKQFLLCPFVNNVFVGKYKMIERIMRKVMEGRYTLGYLQKQIQNFNVPRDTKNFRVRRVQDKWVSAFRKKFLPKTISGIRS